MSELILKGTDLFMKKTGSADKLHICGNAERMLFLIIGIFDSPIYHTARLLGKYSDRDSREE